MARHDLLDLKALSGGLCGEGAASDHQRPRYAGQLVNKRAMFSSD